LSFFAWPRAVTHPVVNKLTTARTHPYLLLVYRFLSVQPAALTKLGQRRVPGKLRAVQVTLTRGVSR